MAEDVNTGQPLLSLFRIACLVPDLEAAQAELTAALGLEWGEVQVREHEQDGWRVRFAYAKQGPPHLEVIEGSPGSPLYCGGTPKVDSIGFWTDDLDSAARHLDANGLAIETDSRPRSTVHSGRHSGLRLELGHRRDVFYEKLLGITDPGDQLLSLALPTGLPRQP